MRDIEVNVFENEQYLQSLIETNQIEQVDLVIKVDPRVISISNSLKNFGSIEIKTLSSRIRLIRAKDKQAQLQVTPTKSIKDLKLILQKKITTDCDNVRGCCMSVNGEYFFTDYYLRRRLTGFASDGTFEYDMLLSPSYGFDITFIDEKTIAITSGDSNEHIGIDVIDTESRRKIKFINLPGRPYGITRDHDSLFVCVERRGIYKKNVISCDLSSYSYISVFNDKIYYTDWYDNSVVCCDLNGSRVWTFKDFSVLKSPGGITLDNDGNVFVVGGGSSNVVILSNDKILTYDDGFLSPSAIFFDKQTSKLLVANNKEIAFLYNVT
ncbi:NID [Mytilus coruscus]|uniref:NID n=1 Tax=Mytilus coruscus TaxID=42192 RepID=A0A6J8CVB2_MYTCO|nr:NID [Mytilus coruscus]